MVIPADWKMIRLADIGSAAIGLTYSPSAVADGGTLVLRSSNIQNEQLVFHDDVFVKMDVPLSSRVQPGDILVCARNGSRPLIGKSVLLDHRVEGMAFGAFMALFRSKFNNYVIHQFRSNGMRRQIEMHLGATINQITNSSLLSFEIPFPSLAKERDAIAEALSDADAAIESLDALIAKKRDVKQAAMQQLLTGRTRLPGFTAEWKEVRFDEVFARVNISNRKLQTSEYSDIGRLPVMDQGQTRIAGFTDRQDIELIPPRDGFVIFGDHTRIVKHVRRPFVAGADGVQILRSCEGFNAEFLSLLLSSSRIPNTGYNRHFKFLKELIFKVPSDLVEQEAIAEALSVMGDELEALTEQVSKLRMVKEGMMQDLLTGKVRLV